MPTGPEEDGGVVAGVYLEVTLAGSGEIGDAVVGDAPGGTEEVLWLS